MANTDAQSTQDEHRAIMGLRDEVRKDIALAIANFKVWLLVTVLSNVVLVGAPAFYVFVSTSNVADSAFQQGNSNAKRLDSQRLIILEHEARIEDIERDLGLKYGYKRRGEMPREVN